ncbi:hypothetical protein QU811_09540, partial [Escherichia coli]|nr:hypothetical protein [Escherichia coli]
QWLRVATVAGGLTLKVTFYYSENAGKSIPWVCSGFFCAISIPEPGHCCSQEKNWFVAIRLLLEQIQ